MNKDQPEKPGRPGLYRDLEASMAGIELLAAILVGAGLGYLADRYLGTFPYLLIVGFVLGVITGFRNAFRLIVKSGKQNGSDENKRQEDSS